MRTSLNASLLWTRMPIRDGVPTQGAGKTESNEVRVAPTRPAAAAAAKSPVTKTPAAKATTTGPPEAKIAKQAAAAVAKKPANRNPSPPEIRKMLREAADRHGIPPEILMAIAYKESNWRHYGRDGGVLRGRWSPTDQGIMQLNEKAHPKAFPRARTDMQYNIEFGARYLKWQFERYNNWNDAIAAYNTGSVQRKKKSGKLVNQYYLDKVTVFRRHFEVEPDSLPANL